MTDEIKKRVEMINRGEIPDGYKKTKVGVVPSEWEECRLSKFMQVNNERNRKDMYTKEDVLSVSGDFGIVNQIDFMGRSYAGESVAEYHVVNTGDVVYTKSPLKANPYGIIKTNNGKSGIVSTLYAVYTPTQRSFGRYIENYFNRTEVTNNYLLPLIHKGAKNDMKVNNEDVLKGFVVFPSLPEQEKIAEILTTQDKLIELQAKKVAELKRLKKAYLQKMFPQNGENVPEIRFKGFTNAWEQRKVSDEVNSVDTGKSRFTIKDDGEYEILGSTSVIGYDDDYDYEGDFLLTARVGANAGTLYRHSGKVKITDNTVFLQGQNLDFLFYLLIRFDLHRLSFGTGQPLVKASELKALQLLMPTEKSEKERIANFFRNLDTLITLHQRKLDEMKKKKKALMQLLLTGKVRVKI